MTTKLAEIVLESDPILEPTPKIIRTVLKSIEGNNIIIEGKQSLADVFITLSFTEETGGLSKFTLKKIKALSRMRHGIYMLIFRGKEYRVEFRKEEPGGPVQMVAKKPLKGRNEDFQYFGRIYLVETSF